MKRILCVAVATVMVGLSASAQSQSIKAGYKLTLDSGTTNTGDAAVTDVALGKTFSSSILTNATGTSTSNATVPGGATILPAQAFVDNIEAVSHHTSGQGLDLSNKGFTHFASSLLYTSGDSVNGWLIIEAILGDTPTVNLSGNALPAADINAILAACKATVVDGAFGATFTLNLAGGTNAAPTGQGIADKAYLIGAAWTVTTN